VKTAISIPDPLFQAADQLAARLGLSRSELYARAVADWVAQHQAEAVTAQLNLVYGSPSASESRLASPLARAQARALRRAGNATGESDAW
jgi:metal-responsive CopG/Arc/MetJ family transcriptional regulator